jgi:SAM-dependent methyltransferase
VAVCGREQAFHQGRVRTMMPSVRQCYDGLANEYHLMFADWRAEVVRQGEVLDRLIRCQVGASARTILDCACGIGTQAIGLATRGYTVSATDLSPAAVARAAREAASFGVSMTFEVADFRALDAKVTGTFDVVLCCDNTLAHLLEDADLRVAAAQMWARLTPGGLLLASIRDYDQLVRPSAPTSLPSAPGLPGLYGQPLPGRPRGTMPQVFDDADGRRVAFQVWDWAADGRSYTFTQFFLREINGGYHTTHHVSQLRALLREELSRILQDTGFSEVCWHVPAESGFYQPLVSARRGA